MPPREEARTQLHGLGTRAVRTRGNFGRRIFESSVHKQGGALHQNLVFTFIYSIRRWKGFSTNWIPAMVTRFAFLFERTTYERSPALATYLWNEKEEPGLWLWEIPELIGSYRYHWNKRCLPCRLFQREEGTSSLFHAPSFITFLIGIILWLPDDGNNSA